MRIRIKRIDKTLPLPEYKTKGAVAFDLASREKVLILPKTIGYAPLNICVETPNGHMLLLAARSSLHKRGLMLANGIGVVDQDFSGNNDECKAALYNFTGEQVIIERGERILQGIIIPIVRCEFAEVDDLDNPNRGGFGSTGVI
ncbi:MAG: dUTP diphosphatase [bacterium]|nr:dUTP diphosphatase [bacterium]